MAGLSNRIHVQNDPVNAVDPWGLAGKAPSWSPQTTYPGFDPNITTGGRFLDQINKTVQQTQWYYDMAAITREYNRLANSIRCKKKRWATFCYNTNGWSLRVDRYGSVFGPGTKCGTGFIIGRKGCTCLEGG